jgi:hypothetical protein
MTKYEIYHFEYQENLFLKFDHFILLNFSPNFDVSLER